MNFRKKKHDDFPKKTQSVYVLLTVLSRIYALFVAKSTSEPKLEGGDLAMPRFRKCLLLQVLPKLALSWHLHQSGLSLQNVCDGQTPTDPSPGLLISDQRKPTLNLFTLCLFFILQRTSCDSCLSFQESESLASV